jgi:predicted PolB exonuclease-like 3'-5' exonuclease
MSETCQTIRVRRCPAPYLVFDIETVPDVAGGRRLHGLDGLSDAEVAEALFFKRRQENGGELVRAHLQRIVAISVVMRTVDRLKVWSLGGPEAPEAGIDPALFRRR